ncbi:hypothetical protein ACNH6B_09275 [Shewanella basaltis]|uniref:hypothetical protein n=1 Tax=Shewanella basaltis TaxID=472183 RepID=UPI003AAD4597
MCRIDAPFGNITFNEKQDPTERFLQVCDEYCTDVYFRELFIKYFQNNWQCTFGHPDRIEEILKKTNQANSIPEKCLVLLVDSKIKLSFLFDHYDQSGRKPSSPLFDFLVEVKNTYFSSSPFTLYQGGMKKIAPNYFQFLCWLYGEDYCYSKAFFDDPAINELNGQKRSQFYWDFFESISRKFLMLNEYHRAKELRYIISLTDYIGPQTKEAQSIFCGLKFIKAWIKFESQRPKNSYRLYDIFYGYHSHWEDLQNLARDAVTGSSDITEQLKQWLDDFRYDCIKLSLINTDLTKASKDEIEVWVQEIEGYLDHVYFGFSFDKNKHDEYESFMKTNFNELCGELSHVQISKWIEWSIQDDFTKLLEPKNNLCKQLSACHSKWSTTEYFELWKTIFLEQLEALDIKSQLSILSCRPPYNEGDYFDSFQRWIERFSLLIQADNFPKQLIPTWTSIALDNGSREQALPYVDKSIGILRGELSNTTLISDEVKSCHTHLKSLLCAIDKINPQKGLRHRLMLQRFSTAPYSDEKLLMYSGALYKGHFYDWYSPLNNLAREWFCDLQRNDTEKRQMFDENFENKFYTEFACDLSEFFLTRLRLRKGEKANDDKYDSSQAIEQSSIWRQGYLKALAELGFDLKGKVHRTVNFTKKYDPDESVRSIASECYKAVRRHAKKSPSTQEIKRSIVAAEWWLLMCQRHDLGLEVKHEEALKTRRNLMRHP